MSVGGEGDIVRSRASVHGCVCGQVAVFFGESGSVGYSSGVGGCL